MASNAYYVFKTVFLFTIFYLGAVISSHAHAAVLSSQTGTLWSPYVEWSLDNPSFTGNPYDVIATVNFVHTNSGETRTTEMFYSGSGNSWKFRFAGTKTGQWTFTTVSSDPELDNHSGQVTINPNSGVSGFVTSTGNQWARQKGENETLEAFVPHFRLAFTELPSGWTESNIDSEIQTHMGVEGFNGLFFFLGGKWVDLNAPGSEFTNNNPDPAMFQVLESIITKVHTAGGVVHLWYNGDCARQQCVQSGFGSNGARSEGEKRLLRYIGARLAPLPGWIMGYGYDIPEDATTDDLRGWGNYLRSKMGWKHLLGARDQGQNTSYAFWPEADWYSRGDWFNGASYSEIASVADSNTSIPHAFDERWWTSRVSEDGQRKLLWNSMLGGGVSAIWGATGDWEVDPYNNPHWFKTYFTFWKNRTILGFSRDNSLSNAKSIRTDDFMNYVFYAENASSITYDLSNSSQALPVVAIDTKSQYSEITLGTKGASSHSWTAPYSSDWVIAVGDFLGSNNNNTPPPLLPPPAPIGENLEQIKN